MNFVLTFVLQLLILFPYEQTFHNLFS